MPSTEINAWVALGSATFATAALTELVSNSPVIAVMMPVLLPVAETVSLDPRVFSWSAPISAGLAFMLPTSTPALAMVFGTGYLRIRHALPGFVITLFSLIVFLAAARWWWPLVGLPVNP